MFFAVGLDRPNQIESSEQIAICAHAMNRLAGEARGEDWSEIIALRLQPSRRGWWTGTPFFERLPTRTGTPGTLFTTGELRRGRPLGRPYSSISLSFCCSSAASASRRSRVASSAHRARCRAFMIFISSSTRSFLWANGSASVATTGDPLNGSIRFAGLTSAAAGREKQASHSYGKRFPVA